MATKFSISKNRYACLVCGTVNKREDWLCITNPFDAKEQIWGCPVCKSIERYRRVCDIEDCEALSTCGVPVPEGYLWVCHAHSLEIEEYYRELE